MSVFQPGTIVKDRYEVLALIGAGGMGAVYQARDTQGQTIVALKQMRAQNQAERTYFGQRFEQEARFLEALDHSRIPTMMDYWADSQSSYLCMEYVPGKSLLHLLQEYQMKGQRFPPADVARYGAQLCEVLDYLHSRAQPLVHRDIKPENVIVREGTDQIVLVDFGIARGVEAGSTKTQIGTMGYAPLEQVRGHPEPRSDLYALGATLYHLLSGRQPQPFQLTPLTSLENPPPKNLIDVVERATQAQTANRYASAAHMKKALLECLAVLDPKTAQEVATPKPRPKKIIEEQKHQASGVIFTVLLVLGVGLGLLGIYFVASLQDKIDSQVKVGVETTPSNEGPTIVFPRKKDSSGSQGPGQPQQEPPRVNWQPRPVNPGEQLRYKSWFQDSSRWHPVSVQHFLGGSVQVGPSQTGGITFASEQPFQPTEVSFRFLRGASESWCQLQVGTITVLSKPDGESYQAILGNGEVVQTLATPYVGMLSPTHRLLFSENQVELKVDGTFQTVSLVSPQAPIQYVTAILFPAHQAQTLKVRDITFR